MSISSYYDYGMLSVHGMEDEKAEKCWFISPFQLPINRQINMDINIDVLYWRCYCFVHISAYIVHCIGCSLYPNINNVTDHRLCVWVFRRHILMNTIRFVIVYRCKQ